MAPPVSLRAASQHAVSGSGLADRRTGVSCASAAATSAAIRASRRGAESFSAPAPGRRSVPALDSEVNNGPDEGRGPE